MQPARLYRATVALAILSAAAVGSTLTPPAHAAPPTTVQGLLEAVPEPPTTAQEAARWIDVQGTLQHPPLLQLQAALAAHRQAMERLQQAQAQHGQAQGQVVAQNIGQGLADQGIDMARLQTDPAYQQQVQERLRRMSPAEQMAFAQRLNAPLQRDSRFVNEAQAVSQDTPAARAAADAGQAYLQAQPARITAQQALWRQTEDAAKPVLTRKLSVGAPKPAMEWDNPGCDAGCRGAWETYAAQMLPLMIARDTDVLRLRRAGWLKQRATVAAEVKAAEQHLSATRYGDASTSNANQTRIVAYDALVLAEIEGLVQRTVEMVRLAAGNVHCGKQAVLVPGAVCR